MIKIGIYSMNLKQKKEVKNFVEQYFKNLDIETEISYIRTRNIILNNMTDKKVDFNMMFWCDDEKISCIKRKAMSLLKNYSSLTLCWTELPLDDEKMDHIILDIDNMSCPHKIFPLSTKKILRAISYSDIEYVKKTNRKTVMVLKDNETEELSESIKSLKTKLPEDYFVDCLHGYIVNFYNIKKIDRAKRQIIMKSGQIIPITKSKTKKILRLFFKVIFGV